MKKKIILFLCILSIFAFIFSFRSTHKHEFAVCAMFQNEAPYLKEWIDYHHNVLGATYFYLYNNESQDNYEEVLAPYIEKGLVELIEWEYSLKNFVCVDLPLRQKIKCQLGAYNDCLKKRALGKVHWVSIQDIDEFVVPVQNVVSFKNLLKNYRTLSWKTKFKNLFRNHHRSIGSIRIPWLLFGTSNQWDIDTNELLTEKLYLRAPDNHPWNSTIKSIHRPESIDFCHIHDAILHKNYKHKNVSTSQLRLHHYWSGPEKKLMEKRKYSKEMVQKFSDEVNVIEDKTIFPYLLMLRGKSEKKR